MNTAHNIMLSTPHRGHDHLAEDYLRQEIAFFESRLNEMGEQGDCAYEHALTRAYRIMLRERRHQLSELRAA